METELPLEILDSLSEGVITLDKEFRIKFINLSAEKITGFYRSDIIGKLCKNVCKTNFCKIECPIGKVLQTGKSIYNFDATLLSTDGKPIPVKLNATVLKDKKGNPTGGIISFRDLSNKIGIEEELKKSSDFYGMIGKTKQMREIYELINEISESDAPVLIQGETGTGKELVANAIQELSNRKDKPYLKINCAVFPNELLGSELFGHVKGAFTHAERDRIGRFELANTGTIFLDEIAEMPLQMQTHLLRILQDGSYERIGDSQTRYTDVRLITATNKNLGNAVKNKLFREDLYFRINVIPITLPALRERKDDIPLLVDYFIKKFSQIYDKPIENIDDDALTLLMEFDWPGNIRQLENAIEYSFVRSRKNMSICKCCLPAYLRSDTNCKNQNFTVKHRDYISPGKLLKLLDDNGWNKTKVAEILGVNRTTVWRKLKQYGLINNK